MCLDTSYLQCITFSPFRVQGLVYTPSKGSVYLGYRPPTILHVHSKTPYARATYPYLNVILILEQVLLCLMWPIM